MSKVYFPSQAAAILGVTAIYVRKLAKQLHLGIRQPAGQRCRILLSRSDLTRIAKAIGRKLPETF